MTPKNISEFADTITQELILSGSFSGIHLVELNRDTNDTWKATIVVPFTSKKFTSENSCSGPRLAIEMAVLDWLQLVQRGYNNYLSWRNKNA